MARRVRLWHLLAIPLTVLCAQALSGYARAQAEPIDPRVEHVLRVMAEEMNKGFLALAERIAILEKETNARIDALEDWLEKVVDDGNLAFAELHILLARYLVAQKDGLEALEDDSAMRAVLLEAIQAAFERNE